MELSLGLSIAVPTILSMNPQQTIPKALKLVLLGWFLLTGQSLLIKIRPPIYSFHENDEEIGSIFIFFQ
ncbi:hypothetical protein BET10_01865 [Pseudoalteromonas amylolytica]|uniref:Uncharacterized protein n=2 Tax=Pseudoalteromonas TaxID=53246 RepID=A0A1S1N0P8_9GAMM|nr:hypothetical protein BFC16_01955 [Pseudoalteromonas sp. JW3]OHU93215.1 hypothetical protein BET10_01865 [Pseudoalteromonas amylolytica]